MSAELQLFRVDPNETAGIIRYPETRQSLRDRIRRGLERHVYVIAFDNGIVKVGQTGNPEGRRKQHARTARTHRHTVISWWFSPAHAGYLANERRLIEFCSAKWSLASGQEAFSDGDFDSVVGFAKTLAYASASETEIDAAEERANAVAKWWADAHSRTTDEVALRHIVAYVGSIFDLHEDDARWLWENPRGFRILCSYLKAFGEAECKSTFVRLAADGVTGMLMDLFADEGREFTEPTPSVTAVSVLEQAFAEVRS